MEVCLYPTCVPSWRGQGKVYFYAHHLARRSGRVVNTVHLLKPLTAGLNVGRISKDDAGTHSWLPLLKAVRGEIEVMPRSLQ